MQLKTQLEAQLEALRHEHKKEIETLKAEAVLGIKTDDREYREKLEVFKEERKDERVKKQTADQSKLISQRQGERGEIDESPQESATMGNSKAMSEQDMIEAINKTSNNGQQ